jgi:acyl-homoserine-lactone acylase
MAAAPWIIVVIAVAQSPVTAQSSGLTAEIRTTAYGVPHVRATGFDGVAFGLGYAFAKADLCTVADRWVTVRAERSRFFGIEGRRDARQTVTNLQSDFYWKRILDADLVGRELKLPPPLGPTAEVRDMVRGYVAGYNQYLREVGVGGIPDRRCRGQEWVRPITEDDVYLRALHWNMLTSTRWIGPMTDAVAPSTEGGSSRSSLDASLSAPEPQPLSSLTMSNMIALGKDATDNGRGMLFANPHWRWHEPERFFETHLTVPGRMDIYGAVLEGLPFLIFGVNRNVAWSHTASVPGRQTVYQLRLAPGSATSYVYEGETRPMTSRRVTVAVREADGRITERSHTFWETHVGPVIADANFVWTDSTAFAVRSVTESFRWLNQQLGMMLAGSVEELDRAGRTYLALGWINTAAADASGNVAYADRSAVPFVTDAMVTRCVTSELGKRILTQQRLPVLDGSRKECEWGTDPEAPLPGIMGPSRLPRLTRTDYVTNSNDSHWTNNPRQLLEGFDRIIGDERTQRSLRTREGLHKIESRLAGSDGLPGNRFTLEQFERITLNNEVYSGLIWRDPLVSFCRTLPPQKGIPEACDVLARWDLSDNLDSRGAVLWRRFMERLSPAAQPDDELFTVPLDPHDPMRTPHGLNLSNPRVGRALSAAIADLRDSGMPLGATLREYQVDERAGKRIPIHGGPVPTGQYNLIISQSGWVPGEGWKQIVHGSSYIMWVQFTDRGPVGRSVLASSQSDNPDSPHHADQTVLFSEKRSKPILFEEAAIRADPALRVQRICEAPRAPVCRH